MEQNNNQIDNRQPCFRKVIGNTNYVVCVHFSETSKETLKIKIKRLIEVETRETTRCDRESHIETMTNI